MIRHHLEDGVLTLTLDRPEAHNALDLAMRRELEELPARYRDTDVRCLVLTGAGDRTFCAGADLAEIRALGPGLPPTRPTAGLLGFGRPTIAAVNGTCVTGGLELALSCDMILAADTARFADTHAALGVLPRWGMSALLPRRIGTARAMELSLSGRWVDAAEAERIGLVNRVVPAAELPAAVAELAAAVAARPPRVVAATASLLREATAVPLTEAMQREVDLAQGFGLDPQEG